MGQYCVSAREVSATTKSAKHTKDLGFYYFLPFFLVLKLFFFVIFVNFVVKGSFLLWLRLSRHGGGLIVERDPELKRD